MADEFEAHKRRATLQVLFRVARLTNDRVLARVREGLGTPGLRVAHTALFPHIDLEGTRPSEIARRLGISKQAVGQLVDELEAMGIVERVPDPRDGRARLVRFRGGTARLHEGLGFLVEVESEIAAALGPERWSALRDGLLALHDALDDGLLEQDRSTGAVPPATR